LYSLFGLSTRHPITSLALLKWISIVLEDSGFYEADVRMNETPLSFFIIDEVRREWIEKKNSLVLMMTLG